MKPLISVVIDNYNYARFLPQAIKSVLDQDLPPGEFETIVVDDGSTDGSRKIIEENGDRVRGIFQPNQGQAAAFNRGIREARGEIVCLLDSDDVWAANKLSRVAERLEHEPDLGAVQHHLQEVDSVLRPLPALPPPWPGRYSLEDFLNGRIVFGASSGIALRKKLVGEMPPIPEELRHLYADRYLLVGALFLAPLGNIIEPLGFHRVHGANFYAGTYADPRKLAADLAARGMFSGHVQGWLEARGLKLSAGHKRLEALETIRCRVLHAALEGHRREAATEWRKGLAEWRQDSFGLFKALTLLLAVLSPFLYLRLYERYGRSKLLRAARARWIRGSGES